MKNEGKSPSSVNVRIAAHKILTISWAAAYDWQGLQPPFDLVRGQVQGVHQRFRELPFITFPWPAPLGRATSALAWRPVGGRRGGAPRTSAHAPAGRRGARWPPPPGVHAAQFGRESQRPMLKLHRAEVIMLEVHPQAAGKQMVARPGLLGQPPVLGHLPAGEHFLVERRARVDAQRAEVVQGARDLFQVA